MHPTFCTLCGWASIIDLLIGVLAMCAATSNGAQASDPDVQLVREKSGWERAYTHKALEPLYNASLYPDLAVFHNRVRLPSALGIANQLRRYHVNNTRVKRGTAVVVIRKGKLKGLTFDDFNPAYRIRLESVLTELQRHQDEGIVDLEDTIFIFNARDVPVCLLGYCFVPPFSAVKEIRNDRPYSDDLLVPLMAYPQEDLVFYPTEKKIRKAALASYEGETLGNDDSCRALVHRFANDLDLSAPYMTVLDTEELELERTQGSLGGWFKRRSSSSKKRGRGRGKDGKGDEALVISGMTAPPPPPEPMSRYSLVLSCDCQTANPGLASLLHANSLVLKGSSNWYEYYYRALKNGVHFKEFEPGNVFETVKEYLKPSFQNKVKEMTEAGQRFAYKYLSQRSRALYFEKAISEYNKLFGPGYMQATVAELPTHRQLTMDDILALPMYPSSWRQGLA